MLADIGGTEPESFTSKRVQRPLDPHISDLATRNHANNRFISIIYVPPIFTHPQLSFYHVVKTL